MGGVRETRVSTSAKGGVREMREEGMTMNEGREGGREDERI